MQKEIDGVLYDLIPVAEDSMSDEDKLALIQANQNRIDELWDICFDDSWSPAMQEILQETQRKIEEERDFLEGENSMLETELNPPENGN